MDDNDDAFFSPIIMFVKFPNLQRLRARNRRDNTNLEIDIKLLQEMMKFDRLKPGTLLIEKLSIYHYYMDYEPHLPLFQKTLNKLSIHPHVELDIRACGYLPDDQKENELEHELSLLEQRINRLQMELDGGRPRNRSDEDASFRKVDRCQRIVCVDAQCWSCGYRFDRCWKCVPVCGGCHIKRMPPMANDNQIRLKKRIQNKVSSQIKADEDAFSVFG
jgi:hypothetical protein